MIRYIFRRLLQSIPTLFGISVITFAIINAAPGGITSILALDPRLTPQQKQAQVRALGLDDPWYIQYVRWLIGDDWRWYDSNGDGVYDRQGTQKGILRGDFGFSFVSNRPVITLIGERLGATLELGVLSLLFGLVLGVPIGILAAISRGSLFDNVTRVLAVIIRAVPSFWLGLMLILIFGAWLKILPMGDRCPLASAMQGCPPLPQRLQHLVMPMFVLGSFGLAGYSRYMRASMLDVIGQDYIRTAKSKGLGARGVWFGHGARNAMIPLATFLGPAITFLWGGAIITEQIFGWPGIGILSIQAVNSKDYAIIMAITIFTAISTVFGYILSDLLYALIDPRIRFN